MNLSNFRVCAIMSSFNEADVLRESIESLIEQGIDVYVLDNCSTDDSVAIAQEYLDKGVVGVETIRFEEDGREIYNWSGILTRKQCIAQELDHDWFLHVDADEIRLSPWADVSLKEAFFQVDQAQCNLVNFKLFNFRLSENQVDSGTVENRLQHYSAAESFNTMQVKAWKACRTVDLASSGGHLAIIRNPKVYPTRFILKHYPVRSESQGIRKINAERKARFSAQEKAKNWHRQYDDLSLDQDVLARQLHWPMSELRRFEVAVERACIQQESLQIETFVQAVQDALWQPRGPEIWASWLMHGQGVESDEAILLAQVMQEFLVLNDAKAIESMARENLPEPLCAMVLDCVAKECAAQFLEGKPALLDALLGLGLVSEVVQ